MTTIKCSKCEYRHFQEYNGAPSRHECKHPNNHGYKMIRRCKRDSNELTIKSSPNWCPKKIGTVTTSIKGRTESDSFL